MFTAKLTHSFKVLKLSFKIHTLLYSSSRYTIDHEVVYESLDVIKNSKFYAKMRRAESFDMAMIFLNQIKENKATHNCWAYRSVEGYERFSDDGEPSGTAGRPILNAIGHENLYNVIVVVIRYYGGVKLGTGGLQRAYGDAARNCIKKSNKVVIIDYCTVRCSCFSASTGHLYYSLSAIPGGYVKLDECYDGDRLSLTVNVPKVSVEKFMSNISEEFGDRIDVSII